MKKIVSILSVVVLMLSFVTTVKADEKADKKKVKKETVTVFSVPMDCQGCIKSIEKNIAYEKGVTDLKCDLAKQTVEVTYKTAKTNDEALVAAFKKIGKEATVVCPENKSCCGTAAQKKNCCDKPAAADCHKDCNGEGHEHK